MVERHIQVCLIFCLSFCLRVRAVAWRHSDNDVSRPAADYALPLKSPAGSVPVTTNYSYTIYAVTVKKEKIEVLLSQLSNSLCVKLQWVKTYVTDIGLRILTSDFV